MRDEAIVIVARQNIFYGQHKNVRIGLSATLVCGILESRYTIKLSN